MNGSHCRQEEFQVRMMAWRMANYVTIVHLQQGQIQLKASHSSWVGYGPRASALVITIEEVGNWCLSLPNICSNPQFWHLQCSASAAGLHWIGPITRLNSEPLKLQTWGFDALWKCSFRTNGQVAYSLNFNIEGGQSGTMSSGKRIATQSSTCKELSNFSMRPLHQSICKSLIVAARCHVPRHVSQPALWFLGSYSNAQPPWCPNQSPISCPCHIPFHVCHHSQIYDLEKTVVSHGLSTSIISWKTWWRTRTPPGWVVSTLPGCYGICMALSPSWTFAT